MEDTALPWCIELAAQLRQNKLKTEVYPQSSKLKKQLDYANAKGIKAAVLIGSNEINTQTLSVKNLITGEQFSCNANDLLKVVLG
jgi:histidyl-tRNA synthetase